MLVSLPIALGDVFELWMSVRACDLSPESWVEKQEMVVVEL